MTTLQELFFENEDFYTDNMAYEYMTESSVFSTLPDSFDKYIEVKHNKKGVRRSYVNLNMSLEISITNTIKDGKYLTIPYMFTLCIQGDGENKDSVFVYGRNLKELYDCLKNFHNDYVSCLQSNGKVYCRVYVSDLKYYYYFFQKAGWNITDLFSVKGEPAYFFVDDIYCEFRCFGVFTDLNDFDFYKDYVVNLPVSMYTPDENYSREGYEEEYNNFYSSLYNYSLEEYRDENYELNIIDYLQGMSRTICIRDFVNKYKERTEEKNCIHLPVTQIGLVKDELRKYRRRANTYEMLTIRELNEYNILKYSPSGGICDYNYKFKNKLLHNIVCFDLNKAYPSVMYNSNDFPIEYRGYERSMTGEKYYNLIKNYACCARIEFINLEKKNIFPAFKTNCQQQYANGLTYGVVNIGRDLIHADRIVLNLTDMDFRTLEKFYNFDSFTVKDCYIYKRGYLPKSLVKCMINFFIAGEIATDKVEKTLYKKSTNSTYGLLLNDFLKVYKEFNKLKGIIKPEEMQDRLDNYNNRILNSKDEYACFHWGVYIAAIVRYNISVLIEKAIELGIWVYTDTDSLYVIKNEKFAEWNNFVDKYNKLIHAKNNELYNKNVRSGCIYKCGNKELGLLEIDKDCADFKLLCKKEYIYRERKYCEAEFGIATEYTIDAKMAGVSKDKVISYCEELDSIDEFSYGMTIPKCKREFIETENGVYKNYVDFTISESEEYDV